MTLYAASAHGANAIAAKCIDSPNGKQIGRERSLSLTVVRLQLLMIPGLRHDLTEEAWTRVCHVRFSSWPDEALQTWLLVRHGGMKSYFDLRGFWHIGLPQRAWIP